MYKRNQVEEAIGKVLQKGSEKTNSTLRSRIRRLLETDRRLKHSRRSIDPERANFAFFSNAMPGRGGENRFSEYEAFSLLLALRLMRERWPQGFVVSLMRRIRPDLEKEHVRILKQDSRSHFQSGDNSGTSPARRYGARNDFSSFPGGCFGRQRSPSLFDPCCNLPEPGRFYSLCAIAGPWAVSHVLRTDDLCIPNLCCFGENGTAQPRQSACLTRIPVRHKSTQLKPNIAFIETQPRFH